MQHTAYKLGEYKIIENKHGDLWWEAHIGLGSLKSGKCFIHEDILFIKPTDSTGSGFLTGEFLDHLNKLPKWGKTKYYCAIYKIYECKSGNRKLFIQTLVMLMLRLLIGCFQLVFNFFRIFIGR